MEIFLNVNVTKYFIFLLWYILTSLIKSFDFSGVKLDYYQKEITVIHKRGTFWTLGTSMAAIIFSQKFKF